METNTSLLPIVRDDIDFDTLNTTVQASLKTLSQQTWSDTQAYDPGVTLLEALAYGVADLAYRHTLPLNDLLTPEGLVEPGLFPATFAPENALTCSPVTVDDYRRALLDLHTTGDDSGNFYFRDIQLAPEPDGQHYQYWYNSATREFSFSDANDGTNPLNLIGNYWLYLALNDQKDRITAEVLINQFLNEHRNIGESVSRIQWLLPHELDLNLEVELDDAVEREEEVAQVLADIYRAAQQWSSPPISRYTTEQLQQQGISQEEIMDGPYLLHGWIRELPEQVDYTQPSTKIVNLLVNPVLAVPGVKRIRSLRCNHDIPPGYYAHLWSGDIATILSADNKVVLYSKGGIKKTASASLIQNRLAREALIQTKPTRLASGRWRKPGASYPVSELLPPCYGLSGNVESEEQKQLHQFMLPFEQLLNNGCQQLAKLPQLLSFIRQPGSNVWAQQWPLPDAAMGNMVHQKYHKKLNNFIHQQQQDTDKELAIIDNLLGYFDRTVAVPGLSSSQDYLSSQQYYLSHYAELAAQRSRIQVDKVSSLQKRIAARLGLDCSELFKEDPQFQQLPLYVIEHRKLLPAQACSDFNDEQIPNKIERQNIDGKDYLIISLSLNQSAERLYIGQLIDLILPSETSDPKDKEIMRCLMIGYTNNQNNQLGVEVDSSPQLKRNIDRVLSNSTQLRWRNSTMWLQDMNYQLSVAVDQRGLATDEKRLNISPYPVMLKVGDRLTADFDITPEGGALNESDHPGMMLEIISTDPINSQIVMKKQPKDLWPSDRSLGLYGWYFGDNSYVSQDRFSFVISIVFNRELLKDIADPYAVESWIKTIIQEEMPAHISVLMHWFSPTDFQLFGENYNDWQKADSSLGIHSYNLLRKLSLGHIPSALTGIGSMHIAGQSQHDEVTGTDESAWHHEVVEQEELFYVPGVQSANAKFSSLQINDSSLVANGSSNTLLILTLQDELENLMLHQVVTFTVSPPGATIGDIADNLDGTYHATLTSGTKAEEISVGVIVGNRPLALPPKIVTLTANTQKAKFSSSNTTTVEVTASHHPDIRLQVVDDNRNPVPNLAVTLTGTSLSATTGSDGYASFAVPDGNSGKIDQKTLEFTLQNKEKMDVTVNYCADNTTAKVSRLWVDTHAIADGTTQETILVTVIDAHKNLVHGVDVLFAIDHPDASSPTLVASTDKTDSSGLARIGVTSRKTGRWTVSVVVNGQTYSQHVVFVAGSPSDTSSSLRMDNSSLVADGTATTVTLSLKDASYNPVDNAPVTFSVEGIDGDSVTIASGSDKTDQQGEVTATVASLKAGSYTLKATSGSCTLSQSVKFVAGAPASAIFTNYDVPVVANGNSAISPMLTVRDAHNNPVQGAEVQFTTVGANSTDLQFHSPTTRITDENGQVKVQVVSYHLGKYQLNAAVGGKDYPCTLTFTAGEPDSSISTFTDDTTNIVADGMARATMKLTLLDTYKNPVANKHVRFITDENNVTLIPLSLSTTDNNGQITLNVSTRKSGSHSIKVNIETDESIIFKTGYVSFVGGDPVSGELMASKQRIVANGTNTTEISLRLADQFNNPVTGKTVKFTATLGTFSATQDQYDGSYISKLSSINAGRADISVTIDGVDTTNLGLAPLSIKLKGDPETASLTLGSVKPATADGTTPIVIQASVTDVHSNPVSDMTVYFVAAGKNKELVRINNDKLLTNMNGLAQVNITSEKAGDYRIKATLAPPKSITSITKKKGKMDNEA
jgi:hypothetical protein